MSNREDASIKVDPEVVSCALGDGAALLSLRLNRYFTLNEVGAFIWNRLAGPTNIDDLCAEVQAHFDVDEARCREDVVAIVAELAMAGLLQRGDRQDA